MIHKFSDQWASNNYHKLFNTHAACLKVLSHSLMKSNYVLRIQMSVVRALTEYARILHSCHYYDMSINTQPLEWHVSSYIQMQRTTICHIAYNSAQSDMQMQTGIKTLFLLYVLNIVNLLQPLWRSQWLPPVEGLGELMLYQWAMQSSKVVPLDSQLGN